MRYLIVNGDDFGMSRGVTEGIIDAHVHGILTSTSMLVERAFSQAAARRAAEHPDLSVGLHVCLTREGGEEALNFDDPASSRLGLRRQLDRFCELIGEPPTHLDAHHHVHRDPRLRPLFEELAEELRVPLRDRSAARHLSVFYGQWKGRTHLEQISVEHLAKILRDDADQGIAELACHPGRLEPDLDSAYVAPRAVELETLCSPIIRDVLDELGVELIAFRDLARVSLEA